MYYSNIISGGQYVLLGGRVTNVTSTWGMVNNGDNRYTIVHMCIQSHIESHIGDNVTCFGHQSLVVSLELRTRMCCGCFTYDHDL